MTHVDASTLVDFSALEAACDAVILPVVRGEVTAAHETVLEGRLPGARMGMRVRISASSFSPSSIAEVVAFDGMLVKLLPLTCAPGIAPGAVIESTPCQHHIRCGRGLLGRVVSCLGEAVDGADRPITDVEHWPIERNAPDPLQRKPIDEQLATGIRVLDGCLGIGLGQRIGLFAGPGLGKSTLLGMLAKRAKSDVSIICLVGERGREVGELIETALGEEGMRRSVVVLAPVDAPPLNRVRALHTATAISEWFRDQGLNVLLLVDSLTRVVRAKRDVALALGETPSRGGFPSSAFSSLPSLIERTGRSASGSITAVYTVLTENRGDDPIAEEARSLLDGHIVLSERLAKSGRWPAVDILRSVSRVAESIFSKEQQGAMRALKRLVNAYEEHEDLILMGAYRQGSSRETDAAIDKKSRIDAFLMQERDDITGLEDTFSALRDLVR
jgi:type III secretion protein N (ATPase)